MFGTIFDIEGDSLKPTKLHVLSLDRQDDHGIKNLYGDQIASIVREDCIVGHNICRFDVPVIERLLGVEFPKETLFVDTMALSWYLQPKRKNHRLEGYGEEFGIQKPDISDWEGLSIEEYTHRCNEDVAITKELWARQYAYLRRLYGTDENIRRFIRYIQFKLYCARLQEESKWRLDVDRCTETIERLEKIKDGKVSEIRASMPNVDIISVRKAPKHLFKADGELSELGRKWRHLLESRGLPIDHQEPVEVVTGISRPNPNSHDQLKSWLYGLGWVPRTFKTNKKGVEVPQINKQKQDGGGVCDSIKDLEENHPELSALDGLFALSHRIGILRGFLRDVSDDGYLVAAIAGFTNTLRFKHAEIVNLPKPELPYAADVRGCLIAPPASPEAPDGYELCGADMSSLEDRTKQHWMFPHDPEYVKEMTTPDFDPHLDLAEKDKALTKEQVNEYKSGTVLKGTKTIRGVYKNGNYSCTYGAGPPKIAKTIGGTLEAGTRIHKAYWKRNWSLKVIAKEQKTKKIGEDTWLYNPLSRFWYSLRSEKDRFSTLNQGSGVFCFDVWVRCVLNRRPQLTGQFHDEIILTIKKGFRKETEAFLRECLDETNGLLQLNRELDIGVEFGDDYGSIH